MTGTRRLILPNYRGGVFTNASDWDDYVDYDLGTAVERFGEASNWHRLARRDPTAFAKGRIEYHANFLIPTREILNYEDQLLKQLSANYSSFGNRVAACIDAPGAIWGKTAFAARVLRTYDKALRDQGERREPPEEGYRPAHRPVCICTLPSDPEPSRFLDALIGFYEFPVAKSTPVGKLPEILQRLVRECDTSVLAIDDVQVLSKWREVDVQRSNLIKRLQNDLAVTIILIGIDCEGSGIFREGSGIGLVANELEGVDRQLAPMTQTEGRFRHYVLSGFEIETAAGRHEWQAVVAEFERQLCLLKHKPDTLSIDQEMLFYLFERTSGVLGSLAELIKTAAIYAIHDGSEEITRNLLDSVPLNKSATTLRPRAAARIDAIRSRPPASKKSAKTRTRKSKPDAIERVLSRSLPE